MRTARSNTKDKIFHVYNKGFQKHKIFRIHKDYVYFMSLINEALALFNVELYNYCIMPNHFHLLIKGIEEKHLSRFMHRISFRYAQYYNREYNRSGKVWHDRFQSKEVKEIDYMNQIISYIEQNPIKAKLTKQKELWPYSSAGQKTKKKNIEKEKLDAQITEIHKAIKTMPYYTDLASEEIFISPPPLW